MISTAGYWLGEGDLHVWGNYIVNRGSDRLWSLRYQELMPKLCESPAEVQAEVQAACLAKQEEWVQTQKGRKSIHLERPLLNHDKPFLHGHFGSLRGD